MRNATIPVTPDAMHHADGGGHFVPNSDPTDLTTQALSREITGLKELIGTRLEGMDKAINLLQDLANRSPTISVIQERLVAQERINQEKFIAAAAERNEKFDSIRIQFRERDTRTEQTSRDAKTAVDAALQAAKEAVGEQNKSGALAIAKSEASTIKQIDQIAILLQNANKATDDKISDLKDRLTMIESRSGGQGSLIAYIFAAFGLAGTLLGAVYFITHR
jgi:hypothetical protein